MFAFVRIGAVNPGFVRRVIYKLPEKIHLVLQKSTLSHDMASSSPSSSSFLLVALFMVALAWFSGVNGANILADADVILAESDAERWTDISTKKLETQQEAHNDEFKVD